MMRNLIFRKSNNLTIDKKRIRTFIEENYFLISFEIWFLSDLLISIFNI